MGAETRRSPHPAGDRVPRSLAEWAPAGAGSNNSPSKLARAKPTERRPRQRREVSRARGTTRASRPSARATRPFGPFHSVPAATSAAVTTAPAATAPPSSPSWRPIEAADSGTTLRSRAAQPDSSVAPMNSTTISTARSRCPAGRSAAPASRPSSAAAGPAASGQRRMPRSCSVTAQAPTTSARRVAPPDAMAALTTSRAVTAMAAMPTTARRRGEPVLPQLADRLVMVTNACPRVADPRPWQLSSSPDGPGGREAPPPVRAARRRPNGS